MKKTFIAAALALALVLTCLPLSVLAKTSAPRWTVPEGYNAHDYNKCAAFLEQTDEHGVKNGEKLSSSYDPNDPATWTYWGYDGTEYLRFEWISEGGEFRIRNINVVNYLEIDPEVQAVGSLDVSGCTVLRTLWCNYNALTRLDVSGCTTLMYLQCCSNSLTELDVSSNTELRSLDCSGNALTELDLLSNTELNAVNCYDNPLKNVVLPDSPLFPMQVLRAEGNGAVGFSYSEWETFTAYAYQGPGAEFLGWYDDEGGVISYDSAFEASGLAVLELIARFEGGEIPGDMDGDSAVDISDALSILRAAMGLITATPEQIAVCDMDGDNELTVADALQVMRMAMGLI